MRLGVTELLLILAIAFIVFGAGKMSGLGKALGTSIREFKQEMKNSDKEETKEITDGADKSADQ